MPGDGESRALRFAQDGEVRVGGLRGANLHEVHVQLHERVDGLLRILSVAHANAIRQHALPDARIAYAPILHVL